MVCRRSQVQSAGSNSNSRVRRWKAPASPPAQVQLSGSSPQFAYVRLPPAAGVAQFLPCCMHRLSPTLCCRHPWCQGPHLPFSRPLFSSRVGSREKRGWQSVNVTGGNPFFLQPEGVNEVNCCIQGISVLHTFSLNWRRTWRGGGGNSCYSTFQHRDATVRFVSKNPHIASLICTRRADFFVVYTPCK